MSSRKNKHVSKQLSCRKHVRFRGRRFRRSVHVGASKLIFVRRVCDAGQMSKDPCGGGGAGAFSELASTDAPQALRIGDVSRVMQAVARYDEFQRTSGGSSEAHARKGYLKPCALCRAPPEAAVKPLLTTPSVVPSGLPRTSDPWRRPGASVPGEAIWVRTGLVRIVTSNSAICLPRAGIWGPKLPGLFGRQS